MKWSELPKEYQELEKGFDLNEVNLRKKDCIFERFIWAATPQDVDFWEKCHEAKSISELPAIPTDPKDEAIELLKEIQEYFERKQNQRSMPLWLSVRIEKVINHNKTN